MPFYSHDRADSWDHFERHSIGTEIKFTYLPKRCYITGKWLWLKKAVRKVALWTGPGDSIFEYRWYDKDEYLFYKLRSE